MADFGFNTDLTVKPTQTGSSIGDIVNMARGVQAYQQAQQINPLEVQQKKTEVDVKKLGLLRARSENIVQNIQDLLQKEDLSYDDIYKKASEINANSGGDENSLKQVMASFNPKSSPTQHKASLAQALAKNLTSQAQLEKLYPSVQLEDIGVKKFLLHKEILYWQQSNQEYQLGHICKNLLLLKLLQALQVGLCNLVVAVFHKQEI